MTAQITPHDWEALSAYLDKQLNPKERSLYEMRLKEEPELRYALDELDKTRQILRDAKKLRAPRNFTLTLEMAGMRGKAKSAPSFYSGLRLASILATFFFILVTAGSLLIRNNTPQQTVVMQPGSQNAAPALVGKGGGGGGGAVEGPAPAMMPTQEVMTLQLEQGDATPDALVIQVTPLADTSVAETNVPLQALAAPRELTVTDEASAAKLPPSEIVSPSSEEASAQKNAWSFITGIQIVLALLALITGVGAIILPRLKPHQ